MSAKFKNKYRIEPTRLQAWNYGWDGAYFISICTQNRIHFFGEIINHQMYLSNIGVIADICWHEIKNHAKNIELHSFIIMPNHIHGILVLKNNKNTTTGTTGEKRFQNQGKNTISSIVGSYKSAVTKHARRLGFEFVWQPLFYDNIIHDSKSYQNISNYIQNNPTKWTEDCFQSSKTNQK